MTVATEIYYTGYHPYTGEKVYTAKTEKEKLAQRSFFFWYKPENRQSIVSELRRMNRPDLIKALYPGVPEVRIRTAEERRNQPGPTAADATEENGLRQNLNQIQKISKT